jgi:hypothetical protein
MASTNTKNILFATFLGFIHHNCHAIALCLLAAVMTMMRIDHAHQLSMPIFLHKEIGHLTTNSYSLKGMGMNVNGCLVHLDSLPTTL